VEVEEATTEKRVADEAVAKAVEEEQRKWDEYALENNASSMDTEIP
jgi:hypothetical protein